MSASACVLAGVALFWAALPGLVAASPPTVESVRNGGFLTSLDDVPLMAGLAERAEGGVVFETALGRIVDAEAVAQPVARLTPGRVLGFYRGTLAALGWQPVGRGRFARDGEVLSISASPNEAGLRVRFSLRPR